ncbi:hypothetical protein [Achromobacter sp.]|uniref:glycoside hydrolase family 19 protein n=1 Tax=Achromobacter sp. TaxID=134375 RepID=UPI00289F49BE|nr:hypothetical protein [Achromobacter sp.]
MSDTLKPTSRMGYPFKAKDGKPFADAQPVYEGLALARGGHFPLGSNGHFHGGIHFDRATANVFAIDEGVQCLADGEIVAYRLDKKYPDATPAGDASAVESPKDKAALRPYSTGFVLVRHRLQAPAVPPPASKDETTQVISEQDFGTRLAARANGPTVGWIPAHARVALLDIRDGWVKVRILPPSTATWTNEPVDAPWLPIFSLDNVPVSLPNRWFSEGPLTATVLQRSPPKPTAPPSASASQSPRPAAPSLILYSLYMHLADGASYAATPNRPKPTWWPKKQYRVGQTPNKWTLQGKRIGGLMVRSAPASKPDNELGILVHGSVLEVEPIAGNDKWVTVKRIIEGGIATKPAGTQITSLDTTGFVFLKELDELRAPASLDRIETPSPPIPVNMGDLIGHMGEQVSSGEALIAGQPTSRPTLHLEVFSGEDVPRFLRDCRKHADKLPERHWTLLRLRKDDQIKGEPKDSAPVVVTMGSDWTIAVTRETSLQNDDKGQRWVNVKVHAADGSPVVGWAKDKDRRCTPWHWPDFEVVDAASNDAGTWWEGTAEAFVDFLRGGGRPPESPFFKQVRRLAGMNDDGGLDEKAQDAALRDRTASRRLGGLIAYHTSEWFVPSWASKYGVISEVAVALGKRAIENVGAEKNCVMRLRWWSDVAAGLGLPGEAKVYHFHPAGLVAGMIAPQCSCDGNLTSRQLKAIAPHARNSNIDKYIESINLMFRKFEMDQCINRAHILAQVLHESGSLAYTKELGTNLSYDPWRGRGLIQITGETNYRKYGNFVGEDTTTGAAAYEKLEKSPHAVLSAGWYWSEFKRLNTAGGEDDFLWCTAVVNGAFNGYQDRLEFLNSAIKTLQIEACATRNRAGDYVFSESRIYENRRYSFAWGLWHDPNSGKTGVKKSAAKAIEGYRRYLVLHEQAGKPVEPSGSRYWYGLAATSYRDYAKQRIDTLEAIN